MDGRRPGNPVFEDYLELTCETSQMYPNSTLAGRLNFATIVTGRLRFLCSIAEYAPQLTCLIAGEIFSQQTAP